MQGPARVVAVLAVLASPRAALAEETGKDPSRDVQFHADRLELDTRRDRLELDGNVVVTVDRYRLTSDRLSLERGPRGVMVEGSGRVAFCPCPDPPVTLGFRSATVAPPSDLLLEQPTLRAYGVPIFWLPYLWLRSPRRFGLLPLEVSYRGKDGLFLGSGVHVPVGEASSLDVAGGGYVQGGAQVDARLVTPRTSTAVRWDHLDHSAVVGDLRGAVAEERGATIAWSVDARRGARALSGPAPLEDVALRQDRARFAIGKSDGALTAGVEAQGAAARGGALDAGYAWSPGTTVGVGTAIGEVGAIDGAASVATWRVPGTGAVTLATERVEARADSDVGPLRIATELRSRGAATLTEVDRAHTVAAGASMNVSLPLVKEFGGADNAVQHWIVPFFDGLGGFADSRGIGAYRPLAGDGGFYAVSSGLRTTLGELYGERAAGTVVVRVAELGQENAERLRAAAWTASAQMRLVGLRSEGLALLQEGAPLVTTSMLRIGAERGLHLTGHAASRTSSLAPSARWLQGGWDAPQTTWFDVTGWSVGGGAVVPWTRFLATAADVDYDVERRTWLGVRGSVGYRHPCRCLALATWASHRLGREGVDVWLTVDLMP